MKEALACQALNEGNWFVQVYRRDTLQQELLVEMDCNWSGNQKFQLRVSIHS
jgi:hypothetical protein